MSNLFQDVNGTTPVTAGGQPVGLVLDSSRDGALGSELVTNGTFDTDLSGWTIQGGGWSWDNGTARLDGDGSLQSLNQFIVAVGKVYELTVDVSNLSGELVFYNGSNNRVLQNGTNKFTFKAVTNTIQFKRGGSSVATANIDNVSVKEVLGTHASQPVATQRPTYNANPDRLTLDLVDDGLLVNIPVDGWDGYMVVGTDQGTASYGVSLPAGDYELGGDYFFGNTINQVLFREGAVEPAHLKAIEYVFIGDGAKESYGDVTDFTMYWREKNITEFPLIDISSGINFNNTWQGNNLTSFPLLDTNNGTSFFAAWYNNNLTSFPLLDTSSGTDFSYAWRDNNLTSFPLIDTSSGTNFFAAWYNNNLTSFPLIDTSSGDTFAYAWFNNNLTSFPLINTSSGTTFQGAWQLNPALADFPANMFDNCLCTNFINAFLDTDLTQTSIDGILVSINSNGTSYGIFTQSDGSAPSATGQAAIDAMRSRGWTITVTGGY